MTKRSKAHVKQILKDYEWDLRENEKLSEEEIKAKIEYAKNNEKELDRLATWGYGAF